MPVPKPWIIGGEPGRCEYCTPRNASADDVARRPALPAEAIVKKTQGALYVRNSGIDDDLQSSMSTVGFPAVWIAVSLFLWGMFMFQPPVGSGCVKVGRMSRVPSADVWRSCSAPVETASEEVRAP